MRVSVILAFAVLAVGLAACDAPPDDPGSVTGGPATDGAGGGATASTDTGTGEATADTGGSTAEADAAHAGGATPEADASMGAADTGGGSADGHTDVMPVEDAGPVEPEQPATTPLDSENLWNAKTVCPPEGPFGEKSGEIMRNLHMKDCMTGEKLDLHDLCGAQAYWIVTTAGWCPLCTEISLSLKDKVDPKLVEDGARIIIVVFQNSQGKPATAEYCKGYAKIHQIPLDRVIMAYDPTYDAASVNKAGSTPFHMLLDRDLRTVMAFASGDAASTLLVYVNSIMKDQKKKDAKAEAEANP